MRKVSALQIVYCDSLQGFYCYLSKYLKVNIYVQHSTDLYSVLLVYYTG